ncbi:hypothetical protein HDU85_007628 [Gaertneriomyces sp. JEL0708]|nr:hypothetical protein HDU85_007628 [Gaertneriomyces sp. JEL0708]
MAELHDTSDSYLRHRTPASANVDGDGIDSVAGAPVIREKVIPITPVIGLTAGDILLSTPGSEVPGEFPSAAELYDYSSDEEPTLRDVAKEAAIGVRDTLASVASAASNMVTATVRRVSNAKPADFLQSTIESAKPVVQSAAESAQSAVETAKPVVQSTIDTAKPVIQSTVQTAANTLAAAPSAIRSVIASAPDATASTAATAKDASIVGSNAAADSYNSAYQNASATTAAIPERVAEASDRVKETVLTQTAPIRETTAEAYNVGSNAASSSYSNAYQNAAATTAAIPERVAEATDRVKETVLTQTAPIRETTAEAYNVGSNAASSSYSNAYHNAAATTAAIPEKVSHLRDTATHKVADVTSQVQETTHAVIDSVLTKTAPVREATAHYAHEARDLGASTLQTARDVLVPAVEATRHSAAESYVNSEIKTREVIENAVDKAVEYGTTGKVLAVDAAHKVEEVTRPARELVVEGVEASKEAAAHAAIATKNVATHATVATRDAVVGGTSAVAHGVSNAAVGTKNVAVAGTHAVAETTTNAAVAAKNAVVNATHAVTDTTANVAHGVASGVTNAAIGAKNAVVGGTSAVASGAAHAAIGAKNAVVGGTSAVAGTAANAAVGAKNAVVGGTSAVASGATNAAIGAKNVVVGGTNAAASSAANAAVGAKNAVVSGSQVVADKTTSAAMNAKNTVAGTAREAQSNVTPATTTETGILSSAKNAASNVATSASNLASGTANAAANAASAIARAPVAVAQGTYNAAASAASTVAHIPSTVASALLPGSQAHGETRNAAPSKEESVAVPSLGVQVPLDFTQGSTTTTGPAEIRNTHLPEIAYAIEVERSRRDRPGATGRQFFEHSTQEAKVFAEGIRMHLGESGDIPALAVPRRELIREAEEVERSERELATNVQRGLASQQARAFLEGLQQDSSTESRSAADIAKLRQLDAAEDLEREARAKGYSADASRSIAKIVIEGIMEGESEGHEALSIARRELSRNLEDQARQERESSHTQILDQQNAEKVASIFQAGIAGSSANDAVGIAKRGQLSDAVENEREERIHEAWAREPHAHEEARVIRDAFDKDGVSLNPVNEHNIPYKLQQTRSLEETERARRVRDEEHTKGATVDALKSGLEMAHGVDSAPPAVNVAEREVLKSAEEDERDARISGSEALRAAGSPTTAAFAVRTALTHPAQDNTAAIKVARGIASHTGVTDPLEGRPGVGITPSAGASSLGRKPTISERVMNVFQQLKGERRDNIAPGSVAYQNWGAGKQHLVSGSLMDDIATQDIPSIDVISPATPQEDVLDPTSERGGRRSPPPTPSLRSADQNNLTTAENVDNAPIAPERNDSMHSGSPVDSDEKIMDQIGLTTHRPNPSLDPGAVLVPTPEATTPAQPRHKDQLSPRGSEDSHVSHASSTSSRRFSDSKPSKLHGSFEKVIGKIEKNLGKAISSEKLIVGGQERILAGKEEVELVKQRRASGGSSASLRREQ